MPRRCYITGTGLVSAQGVGVDANWRALLAGSVLHETGIVPLARDARLSRVSQLAIAAADEALQHAGRPDLADGRTALVVGTSKGPVEDWLDQLDGRRPPGLAHGLARIAVDLSAELGHARGPRLTLAGACASGLQALIRAADLIRSGMCDTALVVAAEASTHRLFAANFARLGVLADPAEGCRPFDRNRRGFLMAEAAAAVWLTTQPVPNAIELTANAVLADATHLTGVDPDGQSLRRLLATLADTEIDLLHAHGTGTPMNDEAELQAIEHTFAGRRQPMLYSHKHTIGHTQGAAGLVAVVLNVEMHRRDHLLGNNNSPSPKSQISHLMRNKAQPGRIQDSIAIAAGFGGTLAGITLHGPIHNYT